MDHKLGLPALRVLSAKWMYTSPCVALAFQKGVASTQMTIRKLRRYAALGLLHVVQFHALLHHVPAVEEGPATSPSQTGLEHHRLRPVGDEGLARPL